MQIRVRRGQRCDDGEVPGLTVVALRIALPHGRYHATPWGHHVNEGLVEWPPSPWRLLRALIATGYNKLGWSEIPRAGVELVTSLASVDPEYSLPPACVAHTRHYMPIAEGRKETTTKVLDTFVRTERGAAIGVAWSCELGGAERSLLEELAARIAYIGRAESCVAVSVIPSGELPHGVRMRASARAIEGCEPIDLLSPMGEVEYAAWRAMYSEALVADAQEKKPKRKRGSGSLLPPDIARVLEADTGRLQAAGWSAPPGTRRVRYWRPEGSMEQRRPSRQSSRRPRSTPDIALLALSSDSARGEILPLFSRALPQAELLHRALVSKLGNPPVPCPELSGKGEHGEKLLGHAHAHFIPLDLDGDRRLDHVLLWAPMGFSEVAESAIRSVRRTWTKGDDRPLIVTLAGVGRREELGDDLAPELHQARSWVSRTPFVPPRHLKRRRHTLEDQVQAELESRGFPRATSVAVSSPRDAWREGFQRFVRVRRDPQRRPPSTAFFRIRLEFETPIRGPLLLGYGSHFGMGLFSPEE